MLIPLFLKFSKPVHNTLCKLLNDRSKPTNLMEIEISITSQRVSSFNGLTFEILQSKVQGK